MTISIAHVLLGYYSINKISVTNQAGKDTEEEELLPTPPDPAQRKEFLCTTPYSENGQYRHKARLIPAFAGFRTPSKSQRQGW
jgi:hypothetical protein